MTKALTKTGNFFLGFFAIGVGLYPIFFALLIPKTESLLGAKPIELIESVYYLPIFYTHIFLGGLALLAGFSQFFKSLRRKRLQLHRTLGKIYVVAVILSGIAGLIIAYFASGGLVAAVGFSALAVLWLYTTGNAYTSIRKKKIEAHQRWMIRSYALCFAAVTLRVYLPLTQIAGIEFESAYRVIAWACWVPNLLVAEFYFIRKLRTA